MAYKRFNKFSKTSVSYYKALDKGFDTSRIIAMSSKSLPATEKQKKYMSYLGITFTKNITKSEADVEIKSKKKKLKDSQ